MARREKALKQEVRDAMLEVLRDRKAPATARAQAGRVLIDLEREGDDGSEKRVEDMTIDEIDAEIGSIQQRRP